MADESTQKWLGRNRPPRVQITYDLETGGAIEKKELPLVVGILADLAGELPAKETVGDLKPRKFVEIDRDNFNDVMRSIKPTLNIAAFGMPKQSITFETIDDFGPDRLVEKVTALNDLLKVRQSLNDLLVLIDGKEALGDSLLKVAKDQKAIASGTGDPVADAKKKSDDAAAAAADAKKKSDDAATAAAAAPNDAALATAAADAKKASDAADAAAATAKKVFDDATAAAAAGTTDPKKGKK
jgi:type VI secretion system protein ImpB